MNQACDTKARQAIEIQRRMKVQYSDACLSLQHVYEWTRELSIKSGTLLQQLRHCEGKRFMD